MKMILTGKAKKDFLSYYGTGENYFLTTINEIEQHANIIEWLDSVGIYINMACISLKGEQEYYFSIQEDNSLNGMELNPFHSRTEATKAAIIKANGIYNERNTQKIIVGSSK